MKTRRRHRKQRPRTRRLRFSQLGYEPLEDRRLLADTGLTGGGMPHENVQPSLPLNYIIATQGTFPSQQPSVGAPAGTFDSTDPFVGEIQLFAGNFAPQGWTFADGQILPIPQHQALFSILGTTYGGDGETTFALPDLRGRVPVGVGDPDGSGPIQPITLGQKGGLEEVTLDETELPSHNHTVTGGNTDPTGGGQGHENRQPFLGLHYIIARQGLYPTRSTPEGEGQYGESQFDTGFNAGNDWIGEIRLFAGNFAPQGWSLANGQVLQISTNTAMFSLLGITYGGNGQTTFALPDLRARTAIHAGSGPGLTPRSLGQEVGDDSVELASAGMPAHTHTTSGDPTGSTGGGQSHDNMMPSLAVNYVISQSGVFPSENGPAGEGETGSFLGSNPYIAEVSMFAGNFAPSGWSLTNGQLQSISSNNALFSLLGTTYGGNGSTTFGLPDLRGRAAMHEGQGPGLTNRPLGQAGATGVETVTLTVAQMPSHKHTFTIADTDPPTVTSIVRQTPGTSPTNADSVTFRVTFSEDLQNVDAADFALSGTASGDGTIGAPTAVTGTSVYDVTITGLTNSNGTVNLDFAGGQNIQDLAGNALANTTPGSEEDYTLDNTAPTLTAFARNNPATSPTNADTLVFDITFDGSVVNVDAGDFDITGTSAGGVLGGSGASYTLTLSGGDLAGLNGTVGLNLAAGQNIADAAGNPLGAGEPGTDETYTLDNTAPTLTAFARNNPATSPTNADTLVFDITFDGSVVNVDANDFDITGTTASGVLGGSGASYTLTLSGGDLAGLNGTVGLNLAAGQNIADAAGNPLGAGEPGTDETYTLDNTAPTLTAFARNNPATSPTNADTLVFDITFDGSVVNVDANDFDITGTTASGVLGGSGASYTLTLSGGDLAGLNGTVGLNLAAGQNIADAAGNPLGAGEPGTDETYTLDNTAPTLTAFARNNPATSPTNADTLVFDITFDGNVVNVDANDFDITGTTASGVLGGSGASYTLTLSGGDLAGLNGTVGLNLAAGQNIADAAGNPLGAGEPGTDETYTLDNTAPELTAFTRNNPATSPTNADTLVFDITFDGNVVNVDANDFDITGTSAGGVLGGSGASYTLTLSGGDLAGLNGTVGLNLAAGQNIADAAGNPLGAGEPGTDETYTLDNTAPTLTAFARNNPATSPTNADTLVFDITFDGNVVNVDAGDFDITGTSAGGVLGGSGASYTLTLSGGDLAGLNGTVGLNLAAGQNIADAAGNPLGAGEPGTDETYTLDNMAPTVTAIDRADADPTSASSVDFTVTFSEAVNDIETDDFALATTGSVTANIASVSAASGSTVTVTVDTIAGSGTLGLNFDFDATDSVTDAAGNAAAADFTGQTYTVQPASAGTLADDDPPIFSAGGFTFLASATNPHGYAGPDGVKDNYYSVANSGNMATWTFPVTPGVYRISANWVDHMNRATNSPFSVFDGPAGGTPVDSATVNQRVAPDDFEDDGVFWEDIFERVPISGSTLTVKLSDTPADGYVIADGMRIELIEEPEIALADLGNAEADIVAASTVDLGRAIIDSTVTRQFRIENLGGVDLNVSSVSISNTAGAAFSFSPDPNPVGAVAALGSSDFTIGLDTSAEGTFTATVTVSSDDGDEGTFSFDLTAEVSRSKIIDNGDIGGFHAPSFSGLGTGYVGAPQGYQDDVHYHVPQTAGAAHANWVFTGLAPGTYQVSATWNEHSNRANNSPFSVVGTTTDGSVPVNQRAAPGTFSGAVTDDGSDFAPLIIGGNGGNFELSGSTLTVKLGTSSSGYVIADAVRIEKLPELRAEEAVVRGRESVAGRGLSLSEVDAAFDAALAHWSAIDASAAARLSKVTVQVANLPGNVLGLASESQNGIWLDADAAGHGWAVSQETIAKGREPNDMSLFTPSPSHPLTSSSFDLLTVVTHELGHVLGLPDLDPMHHPHDVMSGRLAASQRRISALNLDTHSGLPPADLVRFDRLFDRWEANEASRPADPIRWQHFDSSRPVIESPLVAGNLAEQDDDDGYEPFDRNRDDRADWTAADAAFEALLVGHE